tara:strand:+ start:132 stop:653 length:522 start_codon:yes stop_codon:yes gene_type:complete
MKKLFIIVLAFVVHLSMVDRAAGDIPNITLKCYLNLDFSANNTRNTDAEKILHFGLDKYYNAVSILRISNLDEIDSKIVRFEVTRSKMELVVSPTYPREIRVTPSDGISKLKLIEFHEGNVMVSHLIDQATLSLQLVTEDSTLYTVCKIMDYNTEPFKTHIQDIIKEYQDIIG